MNFISGKSMIADDAITPWEPKIPIGQSPVRCKTRSLSTYGTSNSNLNMEVFFSVNEPGSDGLTNDCDHLEDIEIAKLCSSAQ